MCDTCEQAKMLLQQWLDKQGHERCWYYPEIFRSLTALFELQPGVELGLPPEKEFEDGCTRFRQEEYGQARRKTG
jgi:hypothetical protein